MYYDVVTRRFALTTVGGAGGAAYFMQALQEERTLSNLSLKDKVRKLRNILQNKYKEADEKATAS
jgi:hypothetical protein